MADLTINLDFIPQNLDGQPLLGKTVAKEVGRLLCEGKDTEYCLEKYQMGKSLFLTGQAVFTNADSPETQAMVAYFKNLCQQYPGFSNEIKGQILEKFNQ